MSETKSIFLSKTVISALFTWLAAIAPIANTCLTDTCTITDMSAALVATGAFIGVIKGRYDAKAVVYTPKGLPGRDKEIAENASTYN